MKRVTVGIAVVGALSCASPPEAPRAAAPARSGARDGRWRQVDAERAAALEALGYVAGSRPPTAVGDAGARGWWLITSGHAPEATLLGPDGAARWTWRASWASLFPDRPAPSDTAAATSWRRAALLDDGSVIVVFEGLGRARVDLDGAVRWKVADGAHHDLDVVGAEAWGLVREVKVRPSVHPTEPVLDDSVVRFSVETGAELARCSLIDAIEAAGGSVRLSDREGLPGDVLHTNAVEVVRAPWPGAAAVAPGQLVVSMLATSTVAVVDPVACRVVWSTTGPWRHQHDPHLLDDGTLILFDNEAGPARSRLVRWAPGEAAPRWTWGEALTPPLWSATCGAVEPLADGWLVTESDGGRVFAVDAAGALRASWGSRHRVGKAGRLVATVFHADPVDPLPAALAEKLDGPGHP